VTNTLHYLWNDLFFLNCSHKISQQPCGTVPNLRKYKTKFANFILWKQSWLHCFFLSLCWFGSVRYPLKSLRPSVHANETIWKQPNGFSWYLKGSFTKIYSHISSFSQNQCTVMYTKWRSPSIPTYFLSVTHEIIIKQKILKIKKVIEKNGIYLMLNTYLS
jgi:hypothetical protein